MLHTGAPSALNRFRVSSTLLPLVVVPTVASSARLLQGHKLLARAAFLESLLALVPPQLLVLLEAGRVLLLYRSPHALAPLLPVELRHLSQDREATGLTFSLTQARVAFQCQCEDQSMSPCFRT